MSTRTKGDPAGTEKSVNDRRRYLTDTYVKTVRAPETGRLIVSDEGQRGLWLRMSRARDAKNHKVWFVRYRPKGQPQRAATIGLYPDMGLADARARASAICAAARRGKDLPAEEAAPEKAEAEAKRRAAERPETLGELLDRYIAGYCKANQRRWKMTERMFDMHVKPTIIGGMRLGDKPLGELRRGDIVQLLDDLQNNKGFAAQVNRVRTEIVAALNWAIEREWIEANPAAAIRKRKIEAPRERKLSDDELRAVWKAACRLREPSNSYTRTLILMGQRRDEIRRMTRAERDEKKALDLAEGTQQRKARFRFTAIDSGNGDPRKFTQSRPVFFHGHRQEAVCRYQAAKGDSRPRVGRHRMGLPRSSSDFSQRACQAGRAGRGGGTPAQPRQARAW